MMNRRRKVIVVSFATAVVLLMLAAIGIYALFYCGVNPGSDLIAALQAGQLSAEDVTAVTVLKFDPGGGWPFRENDYQRKACVALAPDAARELAQILRSKSTRGSQHRNHPATTYFGILRVDVANGAHYYLYYDLGYYENAYYVHARSNSANSTNPNGAVDYENVPLTEFLKKHDPWYRSAGYVPPGNRRVNAPDTVP